MSAREEAKVMRPGVQRLNERAAAEAEATHWRRLGMTPPGPWGDPIAYGPTGIRCGCGKDAHSNLVPCQPDVTEDGAR